MPKGDQPWMFFGRNDAKAETPVFWPGEFRGLYSPWARKESDTTKRLSLSRLTESQMIGPEVGR